jgi:hypothetical protein
VTKSAHVFSVSDSVDPQYPRLLPSHPRNRDIDWVEVGNYAEHGSPSGDPPFDVFVKPAGEIDAIWIAGRTGFLLSTRLRETLEPVVGGPVDFLPIAVNSQPFWIMRLRHIIDALDMDRSQIDYSVDGGVKLLNVPVWRGDRIPDPSLFQIPQRRNEVWATPAVADAYHRSGLGGLNFYPRGEVI